MKNLPVSSILILLILSFCITLCYGQQFPFPHSVNYQYGLKPTSQTQAAMNADLQSKFEKWRSTYVTTGGCIYPNTKRINSVNHNNETRSEGISYGMTLLVYMDNSTNNTRADFDAIFRYYNSYLNSQGLMKWAINADGTPRSNAPAPDGDEEVAFALLMADKQWGSNGSINYLQEAIRIINALEPLCIKSNEYFADGTWIFAAYQLPHYYKEFTNVTGHSLWSRVTTNAYKFFNIFYQKSTGLLPDVADANGNLIHENYSFDACRVPWRIGTDYLWNGTSQNVLAKNHPAKIATWAKNAWASNPANAKDTYKIDGTAVATDCHYGSMVGPMLVGAMTGSDQAWLNTLYNFCKNLSIGNNYFADHVLMLSLLTATGNMPNFMTTSIPVTGVSVSPTSASITAGSTRQLTATVLSSNATNKNVTWSSSNTSVATVNSNGLVTGVSSGTAIITVTTVDQGKTATAKVTVSDVTGIISGGSKQEIVYIYPNPFISQTTISFSEEQKNITVKITDVMGKEIKTINFSGKQLTIEKKEMKEGMYFMQIIDGDKSIVTRKIMVE
jgi:endo-1,4-beta-D-glucanase Y